MTSIISLQNDLAFVGERIATENKIADEAANSWIADLNTLRATTADALDQFEANILETLKRLRSDMSAQTDEMGRRYTVQHIERRQSIMNILDHNVPAEVAKTVANTTPESHSRG